MIQIQNLNLDNNNTISDEEIKNMSCGRILS
jgi:hypothetical protein